MGDTCEAVSVPCSLNCTLNTMADGNIMLGARTQQRLIETITAAAEEREYQLDQEISYYDNLKEDDIEDIRRKRLEQMKSLHSLKQKKIASGHGEYTMIEEKEFFDVAKKTDRLVVHFWRESAWRCEIMDKHLRQLAQKLHIWCLPSLVLCKDGKTDHTVVG